MDDAAFQRLMDDYAEAFRASRDLPEGQRTLAFDARFDPALQREGVARQEFLDRYAPLVAQAVLNRACACRGKCPTR
jgi:hypothetical protein